MIDPERRRCAHGAADPPDALAICASMVADRLSQAGTPWMTWSPMTSVGVALTGTLAPEAVSVRTAAARPGSSRAASKASTSSPICLAIATRTSRRKAPLFSLPWFAKSQS